MHWGRKNKKQFTNPRDVVHKLRYPSWKKTCVKFDLLFFTTFLTQHFFFERTIGKRCTKSLLNFITQRNYLNVWWTPTQTMKIYVLFPTSFLKYHLLRDDNMVDRFLFSDVQIFAFLHSKYGNVSVVFNFLFFLGYRTRASLYTTFYHSIGNLFAKNKIIFLMVAIACIQLL